MNPSVAPPDGNSLTTDENGYLLDWLGWEPEVAEVMAREDAMELTPDHWQVLMILREYYQEFEIAPPVRALIGIMKERFGNKRLGSRELYRLFPEGPAKQACRYAGLPRPVSCI